MQGPILLTAPHSCQVQRSSEHVKMHLQEKWVSVIVLRLAQAIENQSELGASYVIWNNSKQSEARPDPNYLTKTQLAHSPFHQCLHMFVKTNKSRPLLHLDILGKKDRKNNSDIDLGVKAFSDDFHDQSLVQPLIKRLTFRMNKAFKGVKLNGFRVVCNPDGEL